MACAAQSADSLRMPLSALLAPVKDGQPAQMQHELFTSYMISSRAMLDTASDWQLVSSEHRDWQQIVGQPRYDHMELYRSKNEAMALSAALLINAFRLNDTVNRRWHVVANADGTTGIAAYSGNPNANMTSWEDAWVYTFHAVQKYSPIPSDDRTLVALRLR